MQNAEPLAVEKKFRRNTKKRTKDHGPLEGVLSVLVAKWPRNRNRNRNR